MRTGPREEEEEEEENTILGARRRPQFLISIISLTIQLGIYVFWVKSV
jgi:hypothetical protein